MDLSVIIVSYNVRHFLEQCLHSVKKASENIDCEIFVVDNNSADGSCSMVNLEFPEVDLIINHDNRGFSAANNQAIIRAKGRYILLLNPDTIVEEDTFSACIKFMDDHPDAGAMGVKMIDGKGRLLPESKRSMPTPRTAFFKIFGFSYLFPKSGLFSKYYMADLDTEKTARADILTGAFMFLRSEAVQKAGLLDEDFFMYGEDIDYSYRLMKAGFKNYYYPGKKIIHYKGQSTRQEDLNILGHFYRAMLIFVRKHFGNGNYRSFRFLIRLAILFRAGLSLLRRFFKKIFLPLTDAILIYIIFTFVTHTWAAFKFGEGYTYPSVFTSVILVFYTLALVMAVAFFSGYRIPAKVYGTFKGLIAGTLIILVVYALLPLHLRFSRAIILFSGTLSLLAVPLWRLIISIASRGIAENPFVQALRTAVVANPEGYSNIRKLITDTDSRNIICGRVSICPDDLREDVLGNIEQLRDIIKINRIQEVIFTTGALSASQIINSMHNISDCNARIRIASEGEKYILGSRYIAPAGVVKQPDSSHSFRDRSVRLLRKLF
ncbi:MAG: glycosyltransferase [Bacteroidales bacterium]|nr:glycosyltransferase [Bacteroidales bacterium]